MTITLATSSDVGMITACVCAAYLPYITRIGRQPRPMLENYAEHVSQHLVYKATLATGLVGVIVLYETDDALYVDNVAVDPLFKGLGIGKRLLSHAEAVARSMGLRTLQLATNVLMTENQAMYVHLGYVEVDRRQVGGYSSVCFRKTLVN